MQIQRNAVDKGCRAALALWVAGLLWCSLTACSTDTPPSLSANPTRDGLLIHSRLIEPGMDIRFFDATHITLSANDPATDVQVVLKSGSRFSGAEHTVELLNLPPGWARIGLSTSRWDDIGAEIMPGNPPPPIADDVMQKIGNSHRVWGYVIVCILAGLYYAGLMSTNGHFAREPGVAMFMILLIYLILTGKKLDAPYYYALIGLSFALWLTYFLAFFNGITLELSDNPRMAWTFMAIGLMLCVAMGGVAWNAKRAAAARWAAKDAIDVYVPPENPHTVGFIAADGTRLAAFNPEPGIPVRRLVFWPADKATPKRIRFTTPDGKTVERELGQRPE